MAIGSPLGLAGSVTSSIVSALHRTIRVGGSQQSPPYSGLPGQCPSQQPGSTINDVIQTDTAINPGNSGGALVDGSGRLGGITTAIASVGGYIGQQSGSIGVGFAIPADTAYRIVSGPTHPGIAAESEGGALSHPVVLMHNQPAGNPATVLALPTIINFFRGRGYTFVDLLGRTGLGYQILTSNGGLHNYGAPWYGSAAGKLTAGATAAGLAADPATGGYWILKSNGGVETTTPPGTAH